MNIESSVQSTFLNRIFPAEKGNNAFFLFLILVLFTIISSIGIAHHEMWRDELEPWLIASFSNTLSDFFKNMKMGSNPYVWYLILHFLSNISLNPVIVQIAHLSFSIGAMYLFLRFSNFSIIQKLLFVFGYYTLYEYGIISRGYALTVFFLFLFCSLYYKYWTNNIPLAIVIFFLANATGGFGAILSISLLVFLFANYYFDEMQNAKRKMPVRNIGWSLIVIFFSIWVAIKSISPPSDSVYATTWFTQMNTDRFWKILCRVWSGFIPIPKMSGIQFWNTNIISEFDVTSFTTFFLSFCSLLFLLYNTLLFSKKVSVLLFYLSGTFGVLLFSYMNDSIFIINGTRYHGFLYLIFITSFWLLSYFPDRKSTPILFLTKLNTKLKIDGYKNYFLMFFLIANLAAGSIAYCKDLIYDFSAVEKTGKYIIANKLQRYIASGFVDYAVSPISAYTRKPIYYPDRDRISTFPVWTKINYTTDGNQAMNRMLSYISKQNNDTVLVVLNFDLNINMIGDVQFNKMVSFKDAIVADENFTVYLVSRYNLEKDLSSNTSLDSSRINYFISTAQSLLQQNKIEDCEKVIDKIRSVANTYAKFHLSAGLLYLKKNQLAQAKTEFLNEVKLNLHADEAYLQLGILHYQEQKIDSSIYDWERVVAINPNNIDAYNNLAIIYFNLKKDYLKAETYWKKTIQLNPKFVNGYISLMMNCQNQKDEIKMLEYIKTALINGISIEEIRSKGILIPDQMLAKIK